MDQSLKQEWTTKLGAVVDPTGRHYVMSGEIADAINAALAAAYTEAFIDVRSELESRIEALTQQLAAERSKVLQLESFGEQLADCQEKYNFKANLTQEIVELNKQLAAERQRRLMAADEIERLAKQLLSAQAEIDAALKAPWTDIGQILAPIDLSALHERDAELLRKRDNEWFDACCGVPVIDVNPQAVKKWIASEAELMDAKVREPLVDLLKIVRPFIDFRNVNSREIADRIDVALAKVKEQ